MPNRQAEMADADTEKQDEPKPGLPMVLEASRPRPSLARNQTTATFVSHLLAGRQQADDAAPNVGGALATYSAGAKASVRRMPQGFRKSLIA
jgi:hypothetical protein